MYNILYSYSYINSYKNNTISYDTFEFDRMPGYHGVARFSPLLFNLGRSSGEVFFQVTLTDTQSLIIKLHVYVFARYDALVTFLSNKGNCDTHDNPDKCVCRREVIIPQNQKVGSVFYNYTTVDDCGVKTSMFQHQRYFLVELDSDNLTDVHPSLHVHVTTSGVLDLDELPGMEYNNCTPSHLAGTETIFTCDLAYESFFIEISGNSRTFVTTNSLDCNNPPYDCYNTVLELQVEESPRTDFIWPMVGVVLVVVLIVVLAYRYEDSKKIPGCLKGLYNCTVRCCQHPVIVRAYQAVA